MGASQLQAGWSLRGLLVAALAVLAGVVLPVRVALALEVSPSSPVFTAAGAPTSLEGSTAAGAVATSAVLGPIERLAAAPDGGFVLRTFDQRVLRVDASGRLRPLLDGRRRFGYSGDGGPAEQARVGEVTDVAVGPDGSVYVADELNCNIRRIAADGVISTVVGQRRRALPGSCRDRGDDGPGDRAELCGAESLVATPQGSLLIATACGVVRELHPDGVIRRVAGTSRALPRRARDGELAIEAPFVGEGMQIAALASGETVIADGHDPARVWLVDAQGRLRLLRLVRSLDVAVLGAPDGSLLIAPAYSGELLRRWPDGSVEPLLGGRWMSAMAGIHDGDAGPLFTAPIGPLDMDVAADGGLLLLGYDHVRYVAPAEPQRLAVGIARESLRPKLPIELTIESTLPANATVELRVRGRLRARTAVPLAPGRSTIALANGVPGELNVVSVNAVTDGANPEAVAGDRLGVVPGAALPMRVIKRIEADRSAFHESIGGRRSGVRCRRFSARRIDCAVYRVICQEANAYVLRRDGVLVTRAYASRHGCRLQPRPKWSTKPHAITLPT